MLDNLSVWITLGMRCESVWHPFTNSLSRDPGGYGIELRQSPGIAPIGGLPVIQAQTMSTTPAFLRLAHSPQDVHKRIPKNPLTDSVAEGFDRDS